MLTSSRDELAATEDDDEVARIEMKARSSAALSAPRVGGVEVVVGQAVGAAVAVGQADVPFDVWFEVPSPSPSLKPPHFAAYNNGSWNCAPDLPVAP